MSDTSIKKQVAMFIAYIHIYNTSIIKMVYHAVNVTSTKAKLFAIRCGLNQTTQLTNIEHIIVVTNSIYATKKYSTLLFIHIRFRHYLSLRNLKSPS